MQDMVLAAITVLDDGWNLGIQVLSKNDIFNIARVRLGDNRGRSF